MTRNFAEPTGIKHELEQACPMPVALGWNGLFSSGILADHIIQIALVNITLFVILQTPSADPCALAWERTQICL
jgi:hypothetical protein